MNPRELEDLNRQTTLKPLKKINPGVRPLWYESIRDEQCRIYTPRRAIELGASAIIIGRPILHPPPRIGTSIDALQRVVEEVQNATPPAR